MANGSEVCCALGICCPPARAKKALASKMVAAGFDEAAADKSASWILDNFDLAPKGLLQPLLSKAGELARAHPND